MGLAFRLPPRSLVPANGKATVSGVVRMDPGIISKVHSMVVQGVRSRTGARGGEVSKARLRERPQLRLPRPVPIVHTPPRHVTVGSPAHRALRG